MHVNPYLGFLGQCREAFEFYATCLGGKILAMMSYAESPMGAGMPAELREAIMHARMSVGDTILMGSDAPPDRFEAMKGMRVSLNIVDPNEADRVFQALAEGGEVSMPIAETFWALRFGMVTDRFGTPWMINCEKPA